VQSWERKDTTRIYRFFFEGIPQPLSIEAWRKDYAITQLQALMQQLNISGKVDNQAVVVPLFGVTRKEKNGRVYIWCGKEYNMKGWMEESMFKQRFNAVIENSLETIC
jgi:hypothetical protein